MGIQRTKDRVLSHFYWPGVVGDITRFCRFCDISQTTVPKGLVDHTSLGQLPIISTPFKRVAVDLVGPIYPTSTSANRYILTLVDYATLYPEATPLAKINTESIAEAMLEIFIRVDFPEEVLRDQGPQFVSALMREVWRLVSVRQLITTP